MSNLFEVKDPRGRKVICTEDCFHYHILTNHPNMLEQEEEIQLTLTDPTFGFIYADAKRPERNVYYRLNAKKTLYTKVVVEFDEHEVGKVITAFRTDTPKSGEALIWPAN